MRKGFAPVSLLVLFLMVVLLPLLIFVVNRREGSQDVRSKASEVQISPVPVTGRPFKRLTDDAFVDADLPAKNFGNAPILWADGVSVKNSYLKFDLSDLAGKQIKSAKLRIFVNHVSAGPEMVREIADNSWNEATITFSNKPVAGKLLATIRKVTLGSNDVADLTTYIQVHTGQVVSLEIDSQNPDGLGFNSKEALSGAAELVVE